MPAVRLSSRRGSAVGRRRSSLATTVLAKPGTYGYAPPPPTSPPVTFAPNVTPVSYSEPSPTPSPFGSPSLTTDLPLPIFPPSETPAPPPTRKRQPRGKRRSQGYIPRPPNAFMLFRADFVRQKHVPGTIEANHGSLSKIIGNCWRALPLAEKHIWEIKAKHAKAEHKQKYPDYKFRPVHTKRNAAAAAAVAAAEAAPSLLARPPKPQLSPQEDERRCEEVAALLLQGKKGEELASAIKELDSRRLAEFATRSSASPDPASFYHQNSKFPHPLNLDPMYYPQIPSSPPSSALTSSHASGSGAGSPYQLPMPLEHSTRDHTWRHRRSSSVPLPNDYSYSFPPFMYNENQGSIGQGVTLPPIGYATQPHPLQHNANNTGFILPPPPSSNDSLAGLPLSISGAGRGSFSSWAQHAGSGNGSSFSYPRPSFSFGNRGSFSFASTFGGAWSGSGQTSHNHSPVGRRASSAQAFFSPSSLSYTGYAGAAASQQPEAEEELPDADTSLFEAGFLNSFGGGGGGAMSPTTGGVSPFDAPEAQQQQQLHAPQPVHAVSPLGVEFAVPEPGYDGSYSYTAASTPLSSYAAEGSYADDVVVVVEQQQHLQAEEATSDDELEYPPFEFPTEESHHTLGMIADDLRMGMEEDAHSPAAVSSATYDIAMSPYDSYSADFI
ncbi:HMG box domain-containing protein [Favolaschia claudopus]|uniref:HMG box domain-containing protein n=1 Tax=Favolaschia claudopus TaxID=2862362 RepID=A0AAW0CL48_9AGAR